VIDPECLLAFTTEVARHDARLFDEVLDWVATNGRWINAQRLSTIVERDHVGDAAVVGAVASWMSARDKSAKWRRLASRAVGAGEQRGVPLFQSSVPSAAQEPKARDPHFLRYGLLRGPVHARGLTRAVDMKPPENVVFKCRAAFGIGTRADVMAYLVCTDGGHPRRIAEILGYNHVRVTDVLASMAEAGMATMHAVGRTKHYRADRERWRPLFIPDESRAAQWVNWRPLTRGLTTLWREAWALDDTRADAYVVSSKMRQAMRAARDDLQRSGMEFSIEDDQGHVAESYMPVFVRDLQGIMGTMGGRRR